jgi:hypothetical protein
MALGDISAGVVLGMLSQAQFDDATIGQIILAEGQHVILRGTDNFKRGDGITILSALPWRGTIKKSSALFTSENPILLQGQLGLETDTGQIKAGQTGTHWNNLSYVGSGATSSGSRLVSGGGISIVTTTITVAQATYYISGVGTLTAPQIAFAGIALSSTGTQRFVAFYGKADSTIIKVEGTEGVVASIPDSPGNVLINYSLVTDGAIGPGIDLSGYVLKADVDPSPVSGSTDPVSSGGVFTELASKASLIGAETLTNKRITTRVGSETTNTATSINTNLYNQWNITALASSDTISTTGTPTDGQELFIAITDNGTSRALTFNSSNFRFSSYLPAPTATTVGKTLYIWLRYKASAGKFDCFNWQDGY